MLSSLNKSSDSDQKECFFKHIRAGNVEEGSYVLCIFFNVIVVDPSVAPSGLLGEGVQGTQGFTLG